MNNPQRNKKVVSLVSRSNQLSKQLQDCLSVDLQSKKIIDLLGEYDQITADLLEKINDLQIANKQLREHNSYLLWENDNYASTLSKVNSTWYGKAGIKMFKSLSKLKRKIKR